MRPFLFLCVTSLLMACGTNGKNGTSCTIVGQQITCSDGTSATITDGKNGTSDLVNVVDEPPGASCTCGGKATETGVDTNGNGVLDPSEVTSTTYVCAASCDMSPATVYGDVTVTNSLDLAVLAGVDTITGTLTIDAPVGLTSVSLPSLVHVGGLIVFNDSLVSLSFPALVEATQRVSISDTENGTLSTLDFGALTTTASLGLDGLPIATLASFAQLAGKLDLSVVDCPMLTDPSLPAVTSLHSLQLIGDTALATLDGLGNHMSGTAGDLDLEGNTKLANLSALAAVTSLDSIELSGSQGFTDLTGILPALTSIGTLSMNATNVTTLSLASLFTVGSFSVGSNQSLTTIDLPALTGAFADPGSFGSPALTSFQVPHVTTLAGLTLGSTITTVDVGRVATIEGNLLVQNSLLTSLPLPSLTAVDGDVGIAGNMALTSLDLTSLATAASIDVSSDPVLTAVDLSSLGVYNTYGISFDSDAALTSLQISPSAQISVCQFDASNDPLLPKCQVDALCARAIIACGRCQDSGDDTTATCP